jgi:glycosyltransferase involved in cell wall biosynthesis
MSVAKKYKSLIKKSVFELLKRISADNVNNIIIDRIYIYVTEQQSSWILGAIARELKAVVALDVVIGNNKTEIRRNDLIIFMHYETAGQILFESAFWMKNPYIIWFTHPRRSGDLEDEFYTAIFSHSLCILASCSYYAHKLNTYVGSQISKFVPYGVDRDMFNFSPRLEKSTVKVGISSNYYQRKNPELLEKFIVQFPNIDFIFAGSGWIENTSLAKYNNFLNVNLSYEDYPAFYQSIQLLLNCSEMEGGPIGVIESLTCGTPVYTSRVGIVEDLVQTGLNGNIFDLNDDLEYIFYLFEKTLQITPAEAISESVEEFTWYNLGLEITKLVEQSNESIHTYQR